MSRKWKYVALCIFLAFLVGCGGETDTVDEIQDIQKEMDEQGKKNTNAKIEKYMKPEETDFSWEEVEDGVAITEYTGTDTAIYLPEKLDGKNVVEVSKGAFAEIAIVGVILPDTMLRIGEQAFYYCTTLMEVEFGKNILEIQNEAFQGCVALKKVKLNDKLSNIADYAFGYCTSLEEIVFPKNVTNIGTGAFCLSGLNKVLIPGSVNKVGRGAFESCENLQEVEVVSGVQELADEVFEACSSLKKVEMADTVSTLGSGIFNQCEKVTVYISPGTPAEIYVKENNINYKMK